MNIKVLIIPGDGIGKEVICEAEKILDVVEKRYQIKIEKMHALAGGACLEEKGVPIEEETLELAKEADAVLLGAVGSPEWDNMPIEKKPEQAILKLRKAMGSFANIRPVKIFLPLINASPLKEKIIRNTDLVVVRELTGGIYFGEPREIREEGNKIKGINSLIYYDYEIERIARVAFEIAAKRRKKVTSVDKANVLESSILWRKTVNEVSKDYPEIEINHMYVDNCAMQIIRNPSQFDVILTTNLFGDILSDEASMIPGSIGLLPSASLNEGKKGLYEPIHGSAPDIAGRGEANPLATILSVAMMFRYSFNLGEIADRIEKAVEMVLEEGFRTPDIAGDGKAISTAMMGEAVEKKCILGMD
ncbi:MAG: 3-isopropylmalate dehydrogenase [candidate division WOR-3 bacterium]|nr:3-isopropylmalate dehydrogenase [candidate division WOR-3 bacterium]